MNIDDENCVIALASILKRECNLSSCHGRLHHFDTHENRDEVKAVEYYCFKGPKLHTIIVTRNSMANIANTLRLIIEQVRRAFNENP